MSVKQIFNTSAELDYPTVLPTLDLDFANSKTLDPRITFTRASGGSYVGADGLIKLAGVNEARFDHDPVTGESLGLLVEESRTNLLSHSQQMDASPWGLAAATAVANDGIAPDGTTTADKIISTGGGCFRAGVVVANATAYTYSVFLKYVAGTGVLGSIGFERFGSTPLAGNSSFNLLTGTVVSNGASVQTSSITRYPNNWFRVSITATSTDVTATVINYAGAQGGEFLTWGAQLEQGSFPTSYIPTVASTRTRAADNASITGKNFSEWYRQDEYAIFSSSRTFRPNSFPAILTIDSGSPFTNSVSLFYDPSIPRGGTYWRNSGVQFGFNGTTLSSIKDINTKLCILIKSNDRVFAQNGSLQSLTTGFGFPPTGAIRLVIGAGDAPLNGTIARLTYYPKRLPNSQLQTLTS